MIERMKDWRRGYGKRYYCNVLCALTDTKLCRPRHRLALWLMKNTRWLR